MTRTTSSQIFRGLNAPNGPSSRFGASGRITSVAARNTKASWASCSDSNLLSEQEAHDALVFLAATLVILPLAPNRELGPFGAFNPRKIWELVVLVMAVGGVSYIALRALGSRLGLELAGFVGGFI